MKILQTYKYTFSFLFSALLVFYFIWHPDQSLANSSGDANSIWQTIISFNTKNVIGSYVLYKGILSVYPYTWLYELSKYLNLDQFIFIKIYYATLFGLSVGSRPCKILLAQ